MSIIIKTNEITINANMPPSVNESYANSKSGRYKADVYKEYTEYIDILFLTTESKPFIEGDEWLEIDCIFYFSLYTLEGKKRIKDLGNYEKTITDCLAKNIKGFDDHKIYNLNLKKRDSEKEYVIYKIRECKSD